MTPNKAPEAPQEPVAWLIEWQASETMPVRWWSPAKGWVIDANNACAYAVRAMPKKSSQAANSPFH